MLALRVLVALGQAEVDDVNDVLGALVRANQEVVGLDVTVDDALFMHFLDALDL